MLNKLAEKIIPNISNILLIMVNLLSPVFLYKTEREEYEKVDSRTKDELYTMIKDLIDMMPDAEKQEIC